MDSLRGERGERHAHRGSGRAEVNRAEARRLARGTVHGLGDLLLGGLELAQKALHVVDVGRAILGVARVAVLGRTAREIRAARWMRAGISPEGNAIAVDIEITAEVLAGFEHLVRHYLAAVEPALVVPLKRVAEPVL